MVKGRAFFMKIFNPFFKSFSSILPMISSSNAKEINKKVLAFCAVTPA